MSKLLDYLNHLDSNANAVTAHNADPIAAMTQFGLDSAEQQALTSWNKAAIAQLTGVAVDQFPTPQIGNTDYNNP